MLFGFDGQRMGLYGFNRRDLCAIVPSLYLSTDPYTSGSSYNLWAGEEADLYGYVKVHIGSNRYIKWKIIRKFGKSTITNLV